MSLPLSHLFIAACIIGIKKTHKHFTHFDLKDNKSNTNVYFGFKWSKIYSYKIAASFYMIVAPQKENQIKLIVRNQFMCILYTCIIYVNMNEWYVETWYLRIPINNSLDFIDTLLARVCLEGNVCMYLVCMYYTMYIIRWLGVWRKAVFNAYVLFVSAFFACLYIQLLTAAVGSILYTRYQKRKL